MAYRDDPYLKRMVWIAGESHCLTTVEQEEGILTFTVVYIFHCFFFVTTVGRRIGCDYYCLQTIPFIDTHIHSSQKPVLGFLGVFWLKRRWAWLKGKPM